MTAAAASRTAAAPNRQARNRTGPASGIVSRTTTYPVDHRITNSPGTRARWIIAAPAHVRIPSRAQAPGEGPDESCGTRPPHLPRRGSAGAPADEGRSDPRGRAPINRVRHLAS